jgi:hypothetical protein
VEEREKGKAAQKVRCAFFSAERIFRFLGGHFSRRDAEGAERKNEYMP